MKDFSHVSAILAALTGLAATVALAAPDAGALAAQEARLRISLAQTAAIVVHETDAVRLTYPARQAFVPDRAELLPAGMAMLDLVAVSLREYARTRVAVAVYTDAIGSADFNRQQSQARAAAVVAYLRSKGVAPARLIARGVGEGEPLNAENTPEGRDLNRRLELTITALSS